MAGMDSPPKKRRTSFGRSRVMLYRSLLAVKNLYPHLSACRKLFIHAMRNVRQYYLRVRACRLAQVHNNNFNVNERKF